MSVDLPSSLVDLHKFVWSKFFILLPFYEVLGVLSNLMSFEMKILQKLYGHG